MLPVRLSGGLGALGEGTALGHEGPTVQIGDSVGRTVPDTFRPKGDEVCHTLLATGAAVGSTAALNAPLVGILSVIEKMHPRFHYTLTSIKAVFIGVIMSTIMYRTFNHGAALTGVGKPPNAPLNMLWPYLIFGIAFNIFDPIFNKWMLGMQDLLHCMHGDNTIKRVLMGGAISGLCGLLGLVASATSGGGFNLISIATAGDFSMGMLVPVSTVRVITTLLCFSSGTPSGIFVPVLALGTVLRTAFGMVAIELFPRYYFGTGTSAIIGMGALLAIFIRALLTGIVLVLEMINNRQFILPMITTGLGTALLVQSTGRKPLYLAILACTLAKQKVEQLARNKAVSARENT